jgi:ABC-type molybdate transport system substrate-binding protein
MRTLDEAGLVHRSAVLAGNRLCVIRSLRLAGDDGLGWRIIERPDTRVVTPQSLTDPCGQYVAALFLRASLTDVMEAKERAGTLIHSFGSGDLPGYLADGRADAGIFYLSEALTLGGAVRIDPLPPALDFHQAITFMIGMVSQDPLRWPLARACFDFLAGDDGQALLAEAGFLPAALVPASSAV